MTIQKPSFRKSDPCPWIVIPSEVQRSVGIDCLARSAPKSPHYEKAENRTGGGRAAQDKKRVRRILQTRFNAFQVDQSTSSAAARIESGCSTRFEVDISICHLQVSQSVATTSQPDASICRNNPSPIACDVS